MYQIDNSTAATTQPAATPAGTPGFFTDGNPATGTPATIVPAEWLNAVMLELKNVLIAAGVTPSKSAYDQVATSIKALTPGRLLRTTIYVRIAGVQNVIVDGAAPTTTGAGTHTRLAATAYLICEAQAGGGAGAGGGGAAAGNVSMGAPGASGNYGSSLYSAATFGASQTITVGLGGAGASNSAGAAGGSSSVGALMSVTGGTGGGLSNNVTPPSNNGNGAVNAANSGCNLVNVRGLTSNATIGTSSASGYGGAGGASQFGQGGLIVALNFNGNNALNPGAGGSGVLLNNAGGTATGGNGGDGIVIIREYA